MRPHCSILEPLCRGLVGYISYLSSCQTSTVYSEYLLYEPILRIAQTHGYSTRCEVPVGAFNSGRGDKKRIDFLLEKGEEKIGIEVKWIKKNTINITNDVDKLVKNHKETEALGYVLVFGRSSYFNNLTPTANRKPISKGKLVKWDPGRTKYSAMWFRYC
jgi:hypothetical protein